MVSGYCLAMKIDPRAADAAPETTWAVGERLQHTRYAGRQIWFQASVWPYVVMATGLRFWSSNLHGFSVRDTLVVRCTCDLLPLTEGVSSLSGLCSGGRFTQVPPPRVRGEVVPTTESRMLPEPARQPRTDALLRGLVTRSAAFLGA